MSDQLATPTPTPIREAAPARSGSRSNRVRRALLMLGLLGILASFLLRFGAMVECIVSDQSRLATFPDAPVSCSAFHDQRSSLSAVVLGISLAALVLRSLLRPMFLGTTYRRRTAWLCGLAGVAGLTMAALLSAHRFAFCLANSGSVYDGNDATVACNAHYAPQYWIALGIGLASQSALIIGASLARSRRVTPQSPDHAREDTQPRA